MVNPRTTDTEKPIEYIQSISANIIRALNDTIPAFTVNEQYPNGADFCYGHNASSASEQAKQDSTNPKLQDPFRI